MTGPGPRVLVLGNSHIAAVKAAHEAAPGCWSALDFLGGQGEALASVTAEAGVLAPQDEAARQNILHLNGRDAFALADYDAFVVVGCKLGIYRALAPYRRARFLGLPSVARGKVGGYAAPVSRAMFGMAVQEGVAACLGGALALRIRASVQSGVPVLIAEQPRPSFDCRRAPDRFGEVLRAERLRDGPPLTEMFEAGVRAALPGITLLPQPSKTRAGALFTRPRYGNGSVRLTAGDRQYLHPEDDFIHANAEYGALVLDQIAAAVQAPRGTGVSPRL
ncbi:hypothetical protein GVY41_15865 [Frigidibacter albus]|uniref:Uncharacterized protein n=1 Tax=Frigidibacter albus TaxID=1465486 RepID=A0A6L8VLI8_9RHOB|nr:hypothetical protein [Frigidibacter albus]MZQ90402.1 hypothetical protein [Frigidibacter albus]NBE32478.1 hypothetical protein [Frigidibacter albus]GGH59957.1 hypothetical protein GCM10011341_31750 [Frigidibacter albus]